MAIKNEFKDCVPNDDSFQVGYFLGKNSSGLYEDRFQRQVSGVRPSPSCRARLARAMLMVWTPPHR